jgi:drug/metabolite transporter (DMT)-like permease
VTARSASPAVSPGASSDMTAKFGLFAIMSLIWGATWAAVKVGVTAVPPIFFAAMRYILVGALLLLFVRNVGGLFGRGFAGRAALTGALVNVGTYALLFWGMQFVGSGVSGLINLALVPVGLFGLSVLVGDEQPRWRHALALALGVGGLAVLFSGKTSFAASGAELWGAAAIVLATFCYCLGSVLSRPLLTAFAPLQVTAAQAVVGAAGLVVLSAALEPLSIGTLRALASPAPLGGLVFLVVFGTVAAYSIYLRLVREWGAPRAGLYAFVSPIVALALGSLLFGEPVGWREVAGAATMLVAAALAMPWPAVGPLSPVTRERPAVPLRPGQCARPGAKAAGGRSG